MQYLAAFSKHFQQSPIFSTMNVANEMNDKRIQNLVKINDLIIMGKNYDFSKFRMRSSKHFKVRYF